MCNKHDTLQSCDMLHLARTLFSKVVCHTMLGCTKPKIVSNHAALLTQFHVVPLSKVEQTGDTVGFR